MGDLTDRYVSATLRSIPDKQRPDIEAELRTSIGDAVEARIEAGDTPDGAEEAVLIDLGDPDRLAASYAGTPGYLIGPDLFFDYKRLLTLLMITVVPVVTAVLLVLDVISGDNFAAAIGGAFAGAINLAVHIFFWTTLVFVIIERTDGSADMIHEWKLSDLPARPTVSRITLFETVASIAFIGFFIGFLFIQKTASPFTDSAGEPIPFLEPSLWSYWMWFLIGVLIAEIIFEIVKYRVGRWTWTLAAVNLGLSVLFAVPAIWLLTNDMLVNPEFVSSLEAGGAWAGVGSWITNSLVIAVVIVTVLDVGEGFWKAKRAGDHAVAYRSTGATK